MADGGPHPVVALYERGVAGCLRGDDVEVREVLMALLGVLDFEYEGAARALSGLYAELQEHIEHGRFEEAARVFRTLRLAASL